VLPKLDEHLVLFSSSPWNAIPISPVYPPARAVPLRCRYRGFNSGGKPVVFRSRGGADADGDEEPLIGYFDARRRPSAVGSAEDRGVRSIIGASSTIRIHPYGMAGARGGQGLARKYEGPRCFVCSGWKWQAAAATSGAPEATAGSRRTCAGGSCCIGGRAETAWQGF